MCYLIDTQTGRCVASAHPDVATDGWFDDVTATLAPHLGYSERATRYVRRAAPDAVGARYVS